MRGARLLIRGRKMASELMLSCCVGTRTVDGVLAEDNAEYDAPTVTTVYDGVCKLKFPNSQPRDVDAQSQLLVEQSPTLSLPIVGSEDVRVGDEFTITENPMDLGLVGLKLRIAGVHAQTLATARRFPVEVLS